MKKLLALLISTILIVSCFTISTSATTAVRETEENNTAVNANVITDSITGVLSSTDDVDWYKFNSTKDYFTVDFGVNSAFAGEDTKDGWNICVYDQNMNEIKSYSGVESSASTPRFAFGGVIYVKVSSNSSIGMWSPINIEYDIKVTQTTNALWESEKNDTAPTANSINCGSAYTGSIYNTKDADWYKLNVTGDYFVVDFGVNSAFAGEDTKDGWNICIYDQSLNEIKSYSGVESSVSTPRFAFSGVIYVKVSSNSSIGMWSPINVEYDVKVTQTTNALWESEKNDTAPTANSIKCGSVYTGSMYNAKDADWYKLNVTGDYFVINFDINDNFIGTDVSDGWNLYIYDKNMNNIGSYAGIKSEMTSMRFAFSGLLYIKVSSNSSIGMWSPIDVEYDLKVLQTADAFWENEYNDTVKQATGIKAGKTYKGNLYRGADADYYKLTAPASGTITVKFSRDVVTNDGDGFKIQVKNKSGKVISSKYVDNVANATLSSVKVAKGSNYIVISKGGYFIPSNSINYKISYTFKLAKPSIKKLTASKKAFKATWKRNKNVNGYQIQYGTKKSFKKAKTSTISKNKTVSKKIKKLKSRKNYYVRIRTFKTIDGKKVYSPWSKAKKVKTK